MDDKGENNLLMQKDKEKGKAASNYRPITCLPLIWKLLTGVIAKVFGFLDTNLLLPQEQKRCRRKSRRTNDLLFTDKIMREIKMRKRNLSMAWIDYKKADDIVPHSRIIDCLETVGINEKIRRLLAESIKSWQVELISGEENLGEFNIRQGIFRGYHFASNEKLTIYFLWMT